MNRDELDRIFEQKLSGHQIVPPPAAWDRLESRLQNKRKPFWLWTRVAAAVMVIALSAWIVISVVNNQTSGTPELAEQSQINEPGAPEESTEETTATSKQNDQPIEEVEKNIKPSNQEVADKTKSVSGTKNLEPSLSKSTVKPKINSAVKPKIDTYKGQLVAQTPEAELIQENIQTAPEVIQEQDQERAQSLTTITDNTLVEGASPTEVKRAPIKITYKRSSENSELALLANNKANKEPSGMKKVFQKAQQFKNNELSIGKLRAAKDGLLAFRGDKNNKQSKSN